MRLILVSSMLLLVGCANLKRGPNSIKNSDSIFNLINSETVLKTSYSFELLNLFALTEKKLIFKSFEINSSDSKKAVESWNSDLNGYLSVYKDDVKIKVGTKEVSVKVRDLRRLKQALSLINRSEDAPNRALRKQVELITAFNQNFKPTDPFNYNATSIPFEITNENKSISAFANSSFWQSPNENKKSIRSLDTSNDEISQNSCRADLSEALGTVKVSCGNIAFRIFQQISPKVSALNSALYRRLGYNSAPIAFFSSLDVNYDRALIPQLQQLNVKFKANLKSGEALAFAELTNRLLPYCSARNENCYSPSALFEEAVEAQIESITLTEVALNLDFGDHYFGSWSYAELDHRFRPEVKSLLFVGALTGNTDLRKESNSVVWSAKNFAISHQIQNLNSGLGGGRPGTSLNLNNVKWDVLKTKKSNGKTTYVLDGYRPSVKRQAFSGFSSEEAKWAVRQIAGLSEQELTEALAISGFSVAELLLAREKLLSIQKNMVEALGLEQEFPILANRKIEKNLTYRLKGQPQLFEVTANKNIEVPELNDELINGLLKKGTPPSLEYKRKISNTIDK